VFQDFLFELKDLWFRSRGLGGKLYCASLCEVKGKEDSNKPLETKEWSSLRYDNETLLLKLYNNRLS